MVFIFLWYQSHLLQVPKHIPSGEQSNEIPFYLLYLIRCQSDLLRSQLSRDTSFLNVYLMKLIYYRKERCHNTSLPCPWFLTYIPSVSFINIYFLKFLLVEKPMPAPQPTGSVWKESQGQWHLPGRQPGCSGEDKAWCIQQRGTETKPTQEEEATASNIHLSTEESVVQHKEGESSRQHWTGCPKGHGSW